MSRAEAVRSPFDAHLVALLDELREVDAGEVATYIPELGRAEPGWFSICVCTTDGHVYEVGDSDVDFTIQSISKPFVFGAALEARGRDAVLERVGVEPSGKAFNAIVVDDRNRPFNPMVNAGAIVTTAMVDTEERIVDCLGRYAGRSLTVDESVYESERASGDRNRAIAFLMRSFGAIDADVDAAVDRYFRQCAVSVTCRDLAVMAATLANRGCNPVTGVVALAERYVEGVMSVMTTCGMYDASGEWMLRVGLPAKSGVAGGVLAVLPGQFGIGVFSPRLDSRGNSTRGIKVCERIAGDFDLHPMRFQPDITAVVRRSYTCAETRSNHLRTRAEADLLVDHGRAVRVFELQGELFVATAERVFRQVIAALDDTDIVVLDCKRVTRTDDAAQQMLEQMRAALEAGGCTLVIADADGQPDVDIALEWCEDRILERFAPAAAGETTDLAAQELLRGLNSDALAALTAASRSHLLAEGEVLFKQGDPADSVFFIHSGALSVLLPLGDNEGIEASSRRLARLGPGLAVGEMALVGDSVRSADVTAAQDSILTELPTAAVAALGATHPGLTTQLQVNLARVLADRLRQANEQLRLLAR
jgi:glutaminase